MLQPATLDFLRKLSKNNNKPWFDEQRDVYDVARKDFAAFADKLLKEMTALEPALGTQSAKDCVYRIFRDVRFSNDKTPYKSHFGAFFARGGRKWDGAGYYLHLEPGKIFVGGGLWMPQAPLLKAVRQEIDYHFDDFRQIIEDKKFKKTFPKIDGEALVKAPQGYDPVNPAIEFLKKKSFTTGHKMEDADLTAKDAIKKVMGVYATLKPFIDFLNRSQE